MVSATVYHDHQAQRGGVEQLIDWRALLVLLLIFVPLERLLPLRGHQKILRAQWQTDTLHLLVTSIAIRFGAAALLALILPLISAVMPTAVTSFVGRQPWWLQLALASVAGDIGFYIHHRLCHSIPLLWRFHAIHHSIEELDWLAAHRLHPVDQAVNSACLALPLFALGFSAPVIVMQTLLFTLQSHLIHSNTRIGLGPFDRVFASPRFHHWHHANHPEAHDRNFGGQLLLMDWLFGTLHMPKAMPERYGTDDPVPRDWAGQLIWPFRTTRSAPVTP